MGPYSAPTKQAWKELNEHFGKCPKCGVDPFVGWEAVATYSSPIEPAQTILSLLTSANILELASSAPIILERVEQIKESESGYLQAISKSTMESYPQLCNVQVKEEKCECEKCGATWRPNKWEMDPVEFGFTVKKY